MIIPPIDIGDNVVQLDVKFKERAPDEPFLLVGPRACQHFRGAFLVDETLAEVTCKDCGAKLSPMWVLVQLTRKESRWYQHFERYQAEMQRLAERSRTKCQHCDQMTRISPG